MLTTGSWLKDKKGQKGWFSFDKRKVPHRQICRGLAVKNQASQLYLALWARVANCEIVLKLYCISQFATLAHNAQQSGLIVGPIKTKNLHLKGC